MFGVPMNERAKRVTETVATLKAAFTGEPFEYRGRTVHDHACAVPAGWSGRPARRQQRTGGAASRPYRRRFHPLGAGGVGVLPGRGPAARPPRSRPQPHRREPDRGAGRGPREGLGADGPFFLHETNAYGRGRPRTTSPRRTTPSVTSTSCAPPASTACSPRSSSSRSRRPHRSRSRSSIRCAAGCRSTWRGRACASSSTRCCRQFR